MSHAYRLSTLKVLSDIELPELMPWGSVCHVPDKVFFRVGEIPHALNNPDQSGDCSQLIGGSRYLLTLGDNGKVLVENGRVVIIEPATGADPTDTRAVLMGPVQAILWHQRGLLPLHASAISVNGQAVALAGPSGAGKSTLAAAFSRRKHAVLADDICIVDTSDGATVLPSTSRLRLWREALEHFDIPLVALPRALSRSEKYLIEGPWVGAEEQRLAAVILLSRGACQEVTIRRLRGWRSFTALQSIVHMLGAARSLGLDTAIFTALGKLLGAGVTVWDLSVPDDLACLDQAAETVLATVNGCT
jgi:hypothetical protein